MSFDTATATLETVDLPAGEGVLRIDRAEGGLRIVMYGGGTFVKKARGEPWTQVPQRPDTAPPVLGEENGIVWVGASYDVSPASYFVLRYIRDAAQPQDLLVLPDFFTDIRSSRRSAPFLGMLWIASNQYLLRIDASAHEVARYTLNPDGTLTKRAFTFTRDETGQLRYFDGDSLRTAIPEPEPVEPDTTEPVDSVSAQLREEAVREGALNRDLAAIELQILTRVREPQHADELRLGARVVPQRHVDLTQGERGRDVLREGAADEREGGNRTLVVAATGEDFSF